MCIYCILYRSSSSYTGIVTSSPAWPTNFPRDCSFKLDGSRRGYKIHVTALTFYNSRYCPSDVEQITFTGK